MTVAHMTHRTDIQRPVVHGRDSWGQDAAAAPVTIATDQRCFFWSRRKDDTRDDRHEHGLVEELMVHFPLGTDVRERDRLSEIRDRSGQVLLAGPLDVDAVQHRHEHVEASVSQHAGARAIEIPTGPYVEADFVQEGYLV